MSDQPKDTSKPVDQPDQKKSDTVHLSAEDLRAISGGTKTTPPIVQSDAKANLPRPKQ